MKEKDEYPAHASNSRGRTVAPVEVYRIIKDVVIDKENASFWSRRIASALSSEPSSDGVPVGYLIEHDKEGRDFQWAPLTEADKAAGYRQTPLIVGNQTPAPNENGSA